jgi:hypothetical protein
MVCPEALRNDGVCIRRDRLPLQDGHIRMVKPRIPAKASFIVRLFLECTHEELKAKHDLRDMKGIRC